MKECKAKRCSSFKINFGSKLSRTLSTDRKRASLLLQPCWIRTNKLQASVCRIVRVIVFPPLLVLWLDITFSQILARGTGHSHQTVWQIEISSAQGSMGIPRLGRWNNRNKTMLDAIIMRFIWLPWYHVVNVQQINNSPPPPILPRTKM